MGIPGTEYGRRDRFFTYVFPSGSISGGTKHIILLSIFNCPAGSRKAISQRKFGARILRGDGGSKKFGRPGVGRPGGREAGRSGGREAGKPGGREAGRPEAGRPGGWEAGRLGGREAVSLACVVHYALLAELEVIRN